MKKGTPCLAELVVGRNNNLNIIRFVAAILVVYCHAYPLANGTLDPLGVLTGNQLHCGGLAVCTFFFFGGFLISKSVRKKQSGMSFFKARCVRIFPCLIIVTVLCALLMGGLVSELPKSEYYTNPGTYKYLLNCIFGLVHNLPGVFENNIGGATVNGSLWTLPVEFVCYIACYVVYKLGLSKEQRLKYTIPVFVIGSVVAWKLLENIPLLLSALRPCAMFYVGMLYETYKEKIVIRLPHVLLCLVCVVISVPLHLMELTLPLFFSYVLAYLAFGTKKKLDKFGSKVEISYGMYLCAFPIQQIVTMLCGGTMNPLVNFVVSMPFVLIVGYTLHRLETFLLAKVTTNILY